MGGETGSTDDVVSFGMLDVVDQGIKELILLQLWSFLAGEGGKRAFEVWPVQLVPLLI